MSSVPVLQFSEPLPAVTLRNLAKVARELERSGALLAIRHDRESGRLRFFRVPQRIPAGAAPPLPGHRSGSPQPRPARYEEPGTEWISRGSIVVDGVRWSGRLEVPTRAAHAALLTIERLGGSGALEPSQAAVVIPVDEADAVLGLLEGLFTQARRDGILPEPESR